MSEPLSRERIKVRLLDLAGLKPDDDLMTLSWSPLIDHHYFNVVADFVIARERAAAERAAALEGLLREAHDYMERKGVGMNMGIEGAGLMERIHKEVGR